MRFTDRFPLVPEKLTPAGPWKTPYTPPYVPLADECYGLPTGKRNGVWVLDLDVKGGKNGVVAICDYVRTHDHEDLPDTYAVRTKSGGVHCYFALPTDGTVIRNRANLLPGVDVRGEGGYVRAGGPGYTVENDVDPVAAPAWLVELVTAKAGKEDPTPKSAIAITPEHPEWAHRVDLARNYLAKAPGCVEGQGGDAQMWLVALTLSRQYELPIDLSLILLEPYNERCTPPWSQADLERKLRDAAEKGTGITGTFAAGFLQVDAPKTVVAGHLDTWRQRKGPARKYTFDLASDVAGSGNANPIDQRELTAALTGPGANPDWCGVWQYDLFANRMVAINPPLRLNAEDKGFDSTDLANVQMWFLCRGCKVSDAMLEKAIKSAAFAAASHPLRDYLRELPAPTTLHLKSAGLAAQLFGSTEEDATHVVDFLRKWMIGCVARAMCPGAKFDTVLTLIGPGGWRKSTFFKVLSPNSDWYRSNLPDIADPQKVGLAMRGHWIIELGELTTMRSSQRDSFLEFITRTDEKFRSPYERTEVIEKRQCGIGATANDPEFMGHFDGALQRRFLPVEIKKRIDTDWLEKHRDELWSEAVAAYNAGESWWVDNESTIDDVKAQFTYATAIEELTDVFLKSNNNRALLNGKSATEIYGIIMGDPQRKTVPNSHQRLEIGKVLKTTVGVTPRGHTRGRYYSVRPLAADGRPMTDDERAAESLARKSAGFFGSAENGGPDP